MGNWERGTGNGEQERGTGTGNRNGEQGTGNGERESGNSKLRIHDGGQGEKKEQFGEMRGSGSPVSTDTFTML